MAVYFDIYYKYAIEVWLQWLSDIERPIITMSMSLSTRNASRVKTATGVDKYKIWVSVKWISPLSGIECSNKTGGKEKYELLLGRFIGSNVSR